MGLLTSYGSNNCIISSELTKKYSIEKSDSLYLVTRQASKEYQFVGMTKSTAAICRDAMLAQYMRNRAQVVNGTVDVVPEIMADVRMEHSGGNAWNVSVSVNETDTRTVASITEGTTTNLFNDEEARYYDDDTNSKARIKSFEIVSESERTMRIVYDKLVQTTVNAAIYVKYSLLVPWIDLGTGTHALDSTGTMTVSYVRAEGETRVPKWIKFVIASRDTNAVSRDYSEDED